MIRNLIFMEQITAPSSILISISARRRDLYDSRRQFFHGGAGRFLHRHCLVFV